MPRQTHKLAVWISGVLALALVPPAVAGVWPWPERQRDLTGTWLDAFNFLDLIPGQPFLVFFIIYAALVMVGIKLMANWWLPRVEGASLMDLDDNVRFQLKPSYLELAYLKGGAKAAVEAALCNLHRLGVISAYLSPRREKENVLALVRLRGLERAVGAACLAGVAPHTLTSDSRVTPALADFEAATQNKLRGVGLLARGPTHMVALGQMVLALALVEGLGAIRVARSEMRGFSNVSVLELLMVLVLPAVFFAFKPWTTRAGTCYIRQMKRQYQSLARRVQARLEAWDAPEVLYAVAVFGADGLGGTAYASIHQALQPPRETTSSSCNSCGGGGCGGGGCGGGGCGGGGCGGG